MIFWNWVIRFSREFQGKRFIQEDRLIIVSHDTGLHKRERENEEEEEERSSSNSIIVRVVHRKRKSIEFSFASNLKFLFETICSIYSSEFSFSFTST